MMTPDKRKAFWMFAVSLALVFACLVLSVVKTKAYNKAVHNATFSGGELFTAERSYKEDVSVTAVPRASTWSKVFDFENLGLTEENYQAYTYDFTVSNNTRDQVSSFDFTITFDQEVYISSAWNGALEIHQNVNGEEVVDTVPDMREFVPSDHKLKTEEVDGDPLIVMYPGDYLVYIPSSIMNAMEVPIEAYKGTTPGIILYVEKGTSIEGSVVDIEYTLYRTLTREPLFWLSMVGFLVWLTGIVVFFITSAQIRRYQQRHERDNEIINESIETFTGFIDAKDPYTNGHSKRVAIYTRLIAQELGYEGEELDRIYYVALLHDCGKIGVPDNILSKPGRLTDEEFEIIKSHTVRGGDILKSFKSLEGVEEGALYHHERYDGHGYPEGKAGEDIPFIARMICVADSFDAMNTNRVYRNKLSKEKIISEIETNKGRQFDPRVADVMLRLLRDEVIKIGGPDPAAE